MHIPCSLEHSWRGKACGFFPLSLTLMMNVISPTAPLDWVNVVLGLSFVLFNVAVSSLFQLGISRLLFTAAMRCVLQLLAVLILLQKVFETDNSFAVAGIACEPPLSKSRTTSLQFVSVIEPSGYLRGWSVGFLPLRIQESDVNPSQS